MKDEICDKYFVKVITVAVFCIMEVPTGFEPVNKGVADPCLTTWPWHHISYQVEKLKVFKVNTTL